MLALVLVITHWLAWHRPLLCKNYGSGEIKIPYHFKGIQLQQSHSESQNKLEGLGLVWLVIVIMISRVL